MNVNISYSYEEAYLPTARCKKERKHYCQNTTTAVIRELDKTDFPVAFVVSTLKSVYDNAKNYNDFNGNGDFRMFPEEIRTYNGSLYKAVRVTHGAATSLVFEEPEAYVKDYIERFVRSPFEHILSVEYDEESFTEKSVVTRTNLDNYEKAVEALTDNFIVCDGVLYSSCGEPVYSISTFGLGRNHGGTALSIVFTDRNSEIDNKWTFSASQRDEAIAHCKEIALKRGDTEYAEGIGKFDIIEVRMPEAVTVKPKAALKSLTVGEFIKMLQGLDENSEIVIKTNGCSYENAYKPNGVEESTELKTFWSNNRKVNVLTLGEVVGSV